MGASVRMCRGGWITSPQEGVRWFVVSACLAVVCGSALMLAAPAAADTPLSWSTVNVDGTNAINSISCPTSSLCVAVDAAGNVLRSTNPIGSRSWSKPVNIDNGGLHDLAAVSCPSISLCVAVDDAGDVLTSTNPTGGASAWSKPVAIDGEDNGDNDALTDVSCASKSLCVAVDDDGYVFTSTTPRGGASAWTPTLVGSGGSSSGFSVSCPSAALCAVVGNNDLWTSINAGGTWSEPGTPIAPGATLSSVGCSSSSLCVAGDYGGSGHIYASTKPTVASGWTSFATDETMTGVSCRGSFCAVAGATGSGDSGESDVFTSSDPTGGASAWSTTRIDTDEVLDISCVSSSLCVASDDEGNVVVGFSKQPQTISLPVPAPSTVGSSAQLSPTASSNLPVVLKRDAKTTNLACSLSGDTVSF